MKINMTKEEQEFFTKLESQPIPKFDTTEDLVRRINLMTSRKPPEGLENLFLFQINSITNLHIKNKFTD